MDFNPRAPLVHYLIYNPANGKVKQGGGCAADMVGEQLAGWDGHEIIVTTREYDPDTVRVVDGEVLPYEAPVDLPQAKLHAAQTIDQRAEDIRGKFITLGAGQAMVYQQKMAEAELVLAADDPEGVSASIIPHVSQEASRTGQSQFDTALTIFSLAETWKQVSAHIECLRLAAKEAVNAAQSKPEIDEAATVDWSPILVYAQ